MKGVAANAAALRRGLDKAQIEVGVVAHQDGPGALVLEALLANGLEQIAKHLVLPLGLADGVVGAAAGTGKGRGPQLGSGKGVDPPTAGLTDDWPALRRQSQG